jgi:hypothetical protein
MAALFGTACVRDQILVLNPNTREANRDAASQTEGTVTTINLGLCVTLLTAPHSGSLSLIRFYIKMHYKQCSGSLSL